MNYNDSQVLTYKFSKTIGQIIFNYNLILKRLDSDINWKPFCNCKQLGPFLNPTYKHAITGDLSIIKQDDLGIIMNKGDNFRLSHHLKPSSVLDGLENDFDLFIDKWCKKENKSKESFQSWKNLIISRIRNKIYSNLKIVTLKHYFIMRRLNKQLLIYRMNL